MISLKVVLLCRSQTLSKLDVLVVIPSSAKGRKRFSYALKDAKRVPPLPRSQQGRK